MKTVNCISCGVTLFFTETAVVSSQTLTNVKKHGQV